MTPVTDLLTFVQQRIRQCPRNVASQAYVRAARDWCQQTRWYRINLDAQTVQGQQLYSLGSDPFLEVIAVPLASITIQAQATNQSNTVPLWPLNTQSFSPNWGEQQPIWFAYVPEGQVAFSPTPNATYPVSLTLVCQPRDGVDALPDELLVKWKSAFEAGALEYLYSLDGEAWANPNLSLKYGAIFRASINNGKAAIALGNQTGSQRATPRSFIVGSSVW